jgi:site-specific recombinase XerD
MRPFIHNQKRFTEREFSEMTSSTALTTTNHLNIIPGADATPCPPVNPYRRFFSFFQAAKSVMRHIANLPGYQTPEQHTRHNYKAGLRVFLDYIADRLPTEDIMVGFISYLKNTRGVCSSTINTNYLPPARLFCEALAKQPLRFENADDARLLFELSVALPEWRERIRNAATIKGPAPDQTTNIPAAYNPKFNRLTQGQVNACLRSIDREKLSGLRDYALLHLMFASGLRLSETMRTTLNSITPHEGIYLVTVRGKRSNYDPVPIPAATYRHIMNYVNVYNSDLAPDDPRRITGDTPLWQSLLGANKIMPVDHPHYRPDGMSRKGISAIIARRTENVTGTRLAAHDTRRTCATILYEAGMPLHELSALLRHKDIATTLKYLGLNPLKYDTRVSSRWVTFE